MEFYFQSAFVRETVIFIKPQNKLQLWFLNHLTLDLLKRQKNVSVQTDYNSLVIVIVPVIPKPAQFTFSLLIKFSHFKDVIKLYSYFITFWEEHHIFYHSKNNNYYHAVFFRVTNRYRTFLGVFSHF